MHLLGKKGPSWEIFTSVPWTLKFIHTNLLVCNPNTHQTPLVYYHNIKIYKSISKSFCNYLLMNSKFLQFFNSTTRVSIYYFSYSSPMCLIISYVRTYSSTMWLLVSPFCALAGSDVCINVQHYQQATLKLQSV